MTRIVYAALPVSLAGNVGEFLAGVKLQCLSYRSQFLRFREARRLQRHELGGHTCLPLVLLSNVWQDPVVSVHRQ